MRMLHAAKNLEKMTKKRALKKNQTTENLEKHLFTEITSNEVVRINNFASGSQIYL